MALFYEYDSLGLHATGSATQDISLVNVVGYSSSGMGFMFDQIVLGVRMTGCKMIMEPANPNQLISVAVDRTHNSAIQGDIILKDNDIGFNGDDGLNIHSLLMPISQVQKLGSTSQNISFAATRPAVARDPVFHV